MKQPDTHILTIADLLCNRGAGVFHAYLVEEIDGSGCGQCRWHNVGQHLAISSPGHFC